MLNYGRLVQFGNIFQLSLKCDVEKLKKEISQFEFCQYNPDKDVPRYGLSVTSLDGEMNGADLDTLIDKDLRELDFTVPTEVYYKSEEVRKLVDPFKPWLGRTHFLNIKNGGYFPPHRDSKGKNQHAFRVIVPISDFNPPYHYMIHDNKILHLNLGCAYFMNTNIPHCDFSFSDETLMLVMNVKSCEESHEVILENLKEM